MRQFRRLYLPLVVAILLVTLFVGISLTRTDLAKLEESQSAQMALAREILTSALLLPMNQLKGMTQEPDINRGIRLSSVPAQEMLESHLTTILYRNPFYDQVHWLDAEGQELVRAKQGPDGPITLARSALVDEGHREWFRKMIGQPVGGTFMSAMELKKNGATSADSSLPVIRFGIRLPSERGQDLGLLVLDLNARDFLERLRSIKRRSLGESILLLNAQGYWLLTPQQKDAFGFSTGNTQNSFARRNPEEWKRFTAEKAGQFLDADGLWTWETFDPAAVFQDKLVAAETWKIVTHVPARTIGHILWNRWWPLLAVAATSVSIVLFGARAYRRLWYQREATASELKLAAAQIETENRLRLATEGADVGVWHWDMASGNLTWTKQCRNHLELPDNAEPSFDHFYSVMHPDDRERVKQAVAAAIEQRRDYYEEYRIVAPDGSMRWISAPGRVYTKPDGSIESMSGLTIDITQRRKAEEALREMAANLEQKVEERTAELQRSEEQYRLIANNASDIIVRLDRDGKVAWVSPSLQSALGWEPSEWIGRAVPELVGDAESARKYLDAAGPANRGETVVRRCTVLAKDRSSHWIAVHAGPFRNGKGEIEGMVASLRLIDTEVAGERARQHQQDIIAAERKHLADVIEGSDTCTWEWNVQTGETVFNEVWANLIGYRLEELQPVSIETWMKFAHPEDLARSNELLQRCFRREAEVYECEARMKHRNGEWIWVLDRGRVVEWTEDGKPLRMLGSHRDITANVKLRQELEHQATTDALTGLCNRRQFEVHAHRELSRAQRSGAPLAVLAMDIDKFKSINDTYGHAAGDAVLKALARACAPHLREVDTLARLGGEEFAVLLPETDLAAAQHVAERIRQALAEEGVASSNTETIRFTVSLGAAEYKDGTEDLATLLHRADAALYRAKQTGRNRVCTA